MHPRSAPAWILALGLLASGLCLAQTPPPQDATASVTVQLPAGRLRGTGGDIVAFKGIPYARPPVGELRWRAPVEPPPWDGTRDATAFGPACLQTANRPQSEDCLFLNVWAPRSAIGAAQKLPVVVWVFGGSFHGGSGDIDGVPTAQRGVVVVSMNYRVSTFGFMAHPGLSAESPDKVSGNYGLLDIMQSLKWVKANIASLGGDPDRVTIWGLSSGASAITAVMASPRSSGLFQRAILQSPGSFRHWKTLAQAEQQGLGLGADIAALRALPAAQVRLIQNTGGGSTIRAMSDSRVIGPVLDGQVLPLEEQPALESGQMALVPILVGTVTDEGSPFTRNYPVTSVDAYRHYLSEPRIFGDLGAEAFKLYPVDSDAEVKRAIAMSFGDIQFWFGARGMARAAAAKGLPAYRYHFSRKTQGGAGADPVHAGELNYVFGSPRLAAPPYTADDLRISHAMGDAWVRFAATGNPNGGLIQTWPRYENASEKVFVFDTAFSVVEGLRNAELDFIGRFKAGARRP